MAIKKARTSKKPPYAVANASSVAMAETPHHGHGPGGADHLQPPPPPLPPGVYFSPTREECLGLLNRHIAGGDRETADERGYVFRANVYGESPDALRLRHPPASVRGRGEHAWWFLSETRFHSQAVGGGASKRADRRVETGGYWRLEQGKEKLEQSSKKRKKEQSNEDIDEDADGVKNCFCFYVGSEKTPWLMQEFTSANDDGAGKHGVPALYRVYVTPRATGDQLHAVFGEHHVKKGPDGKKLPARLMVPEEYFDVIAEQLPEGSVRGLVQEHLQGQYLGQYEQGQYLGQYEQQQEQCLQYEQQQGQYLGGQYEQQQGPASPGFLGELTAEEQSSDNLSMSMADFMRMINEQPVEMVNEQPAETVNWEEPSWESLPDIFEADEFAKF
jgi:hypothetical protein